MSFSARLRQVGIELKAHSPFTLFGALTGIAMMLLFRNISHEASYRLFYIFHPVHVVLSAMVTASLFRLHEKTRGFLVVLLVGYIGSIGVATLSDSILPYFGEDILGVLVPTESVVHSHNSQDGGQKMEERGQDARDTTQHAERTTQDEKEWHIGFIEEWYIVNPSALLGIFIAYFLPRSKMPHAFHILISTWASSAHVMMNTPQPYTATLMVGFLIVLFIAVWLPCCFSDIIFPMLLVKADGEQCALCDGGTHRER